MNSVVFHHVDVFLAKLSKLSPKMVQASETNPKTQTRFQISILARYKLTNAAPVSNCFVSEQDAVFCGYDHSGVGSDRHNWVRIVWKYKVDVWDEISGYKI